MYYIKGFYLNDDIIENTQIVVKKFETEEQCKQYINEEIDWYFEDETNPSFQENAEIYNNGFAYDDGELEIEDCYYQLNYTTEEMAKNITDLFNKLGKDSLSLVSPNGNMPKFENISFKNITKEDDKIYVSCENSKYELTNLDVCGLICVYQSMKFLYDYE